MTTTTATPTYTYRAQTDPSTKHWHLGAAERDRKSFCGVELIAPDDTRPFARKVPEADRHMTVSDDLAKVTCGACKRNREYSYATGTATRPAPAVPAPRGTRSTSTGTTTRRRGGRPATGDPRADRAAADTRPPSSTQASNAAEATANANGTPSQRKRRQSRADRANAAQARDRAKAEAAAAVDAINAALAANDAANGATTTPAPEAE